MKFLVDENLSKILAEALTKAGHDAVHVVDLGASSVPDTEVMALAESQGRIIVSADTDFGSLLASTRAIQPSTILVRELVTLPPGDLAEVLLHNLDLIEEHLASGAIVAIGPGGIRVRAAEARRRGHPARAWAVSAIYATNIVLLQGTLKALKAAEALIPQDISVIGFDDFDWAELLHPPMTVVDQHIADIGTAAGQRVLDVIASDTSEKHQTVFAPVHIGTDLVLRDSCSSPKPSLRRRPRGGPATP